MCGASSSREASLGSAAIAGAILSSSAARGEPGGASPSCWQRAAASRPHEAQLAPSRSTTCRRSEAVQRRPANAARQAPPQKSSASLSGAAVGWRLHAGSSAAGWLLAGQWPSAAEAELSRSAVEVEAGAEADDVIAVEEAGAVLVAAQVLTAGGPSAHGACSWKPVGSRRSVA